MASNEDGASVFLSYARRQPDEDWAARLVEVLRRHYGVQVFFDKGHITIGQDFNSEIKSLIRASDALIFLGSSLSLTSTGCRDECVYARDQGKPIIPLFIEHTSWGHFPADFHSRHFEQLQRAKSEDEFVALIGKGLLAAGLAIDRTKVPELPNFPVWASDVYPAYGKIRQVEAPLRKYVEECSHSLKLSSENGYHNLNLALLYLRLAEHRRAIDFAEKALLDLPGRSDAHYFVALIAAATGPLFSMPLVRAARIKRSLETAIQLGIEAVPKSRSVGAALPWLLKAITAHDYYARNGLIPPEQPEALLNEARQRECNAEEADRLRDSLSGLSNWSRRAIENFKG